MMFGRTPRQGSRAVREVRLSMGIVARKWGDVGTGGGNKIRRYNT
ncbi:hypothetical protein DCCM_4550 [Desulfocucumis palustris]|uniref:Uncharacterized protein n=1 Tax=Desulfocucumis palustris TaxID=1898651 RepID=A0A2L2XIA3_9FIRM|nr:hypothetical protein DCCM_4550 [Desulfocucumis palustris]